MDIEIRNISKAFDGKEVFDDFSCIFRQGCLNLLMGSSGSGKTTLLRLVMGILKADSGSIHGTKDKRIRAVFQEDRLLLNMSVAVNINLVLEEKYSDGEIAEYLRRLNVDVPPSERAERLSKGMKRRLAVLRAVLAEPDILILDEAFSGLDAENAQNTLSFIIENMKGRTIVAATHKEQLFFGLNYNKITLP